ncbi:MAG: hypothetical protein ABIS29_06985 [Vicinamibacterales bacterium]
MSPADATAVATRARERIQRFAARQPEAAKLARFASLAVSVDTPLLRSLRIALLPGSDAGVEADLWFSTLTESVSSQGFVLDTSVVEQLRQDLASEIADGEQRALNRAAAITKESHHDWPPSLQLEEHVTWLALRRSSGETTTPHREELETLLRSMLKTMTEDAARGLEIARWAQRALRRLPPAARETDAAFLLALGAAERLNVPVTVSDADRPGSLSEIATWVLPDGAFKHRTRIGVRRYVDGLEFLEPDQAQMRLEIPKTTPLYLQVSWIADNIRTARMASIEIGRKLEIPATATDIRLQSLAGDEFALESVVTAEAGDDVVDRVVDITRGCVRVDFKGVSSSGFFVNGDTILTFWPDSKGERRVGSSCEVTWQKRRVSGTVVAERRPGDEVLVRLREEIPGAIVLQRHTESSAIKVGDPWRSVNVIQSPSTQIEGVVSVLNATAPTLTGDGVDGLPLIGLKVVAESRRLEAPGLAGAPVVIGNTVIGHLIFSAGMGDHQTDLYARSSAAVSHFIADALRPPEHQPVVFVSYAASDSYGKGTEIDSAQVDRVMEGIRTAGVNPWLDRELTQNRSSAREDVLKAVSISAGGAIIVTPVSHLEPETANLELQALAYRRWAKADYPLAMFQFRRQGLRGRGRTPPDIERLQGLDVDKASADELRNYVTTTFGTIARTSDEASGLVAVQQRLEALLRKVPRLLNEQSSSSQAVRVVGRSDAIDAAKAIRDRGLQALIPSWSNWARYFSTDEARELVNTAAMFSFPPETHVPLLPVAHRQVKSAAFAVNAMQINVAQALIKRAWIGQAPPRTIILRDGWSEIRKPDDVIKRLSHEVAEALGCSEEDSTWLIRHLDAPIFLIFATRPVPPLDYVADLRRALPFALLFFLAGEETESMVSSNEVVTGLPRLPKGADSEFMKGYKLLMDSVEHNRDSSPDGPPRPQPSANRASQSAPQPNRASQNAPQPSSTRKRAPAAKPLLKKASRKRAQTKRSMKKK